MNYGRTGAPREFHGSPTAPTGRTDGRAGARTADPHGRTDGWTDERAHGRPSPTGGRADGLENPPTPRRVGIKADQPTFRRDIVSPVDDRHPAIQPIEPLVVFLSGAIPMR